MKTRIKNDENQDKQNLFIQAFCLVTRYVKPIYAFLFYRESIGSLVVKEAFDVSIRKVAIRRSQGEKTRKKTAQGQLKNRITDNRNVQAVKTKKRVREV
jgi:hypothetical protein